MSEQLPAEEPLYYLQCRGFNGDSLLWWRKGRNGYTTDLRKAHVFTKEEAFAQARCRPTEDFPWRKDYVDARAQPHIVQGAINKNDEDAR